MDISEENNKRAMSLDEVIRLSSILSQLNLNGRSI